MAETFRQKLKKNSNRVKAKDRGLYPSIQRNYKVKLRDEKNISSECKETGLGRLF